MGLQNGSLQLLFLVLLSGIFYLETIKLTTCYDNVNNSDCYETEKKALLKFKGGLTDPLGQLSSWVGENCCTWRGVRCNSRTGNVIKLKLRNQFPDSYDSNGIAGGLGGGLTEAFSKLCNLQILKLNVNEITGEVNKFIDGLAGCPNSRLETLDLGYNQLAGTLPTTLGDLRDLRHLRLPSNAFKGPIPNSIGNLSVLEELDISQNQMSGSIPQSLGQLSSLIVLELSENPWEGVITEAHFANLSSLRELSMQKGSPNISLVFDIDPHWLPPFKLRTVPTWETLILETINYPETFYLGLEKACHPY
ncbi:hypothetical protein Acr_00g0014220 [Actinidia rufa]|uniref:Leucine-rich repeat (LRR) family protein n=1 Tax=Actinidia rufa TaxID=165716 RepID=A0A7J0DBM6_9ERIC|nr:hypothetical protein Acr_00g0014220 [Actinidia rufa]